MSDEQTLPNSDSAREPSGELKDQATTSQTSSTEAKSDAQATADSTLTQSKSDNKSSDGKTLLNKDDKAKDAPAGAPEKYGDFKVPDGFTLDAEVSKTAGELFKSLNLPQDAAQKLVDFYTAQAQKAFDAPFDAYAKQREEWQGQVKADPELGGKIDKVRETFAKGLAVLGDAKLASDFREAMDFTGAGDHPAFIKVMYKLSQLLTEGSHVSGTGPSAHGQNRSGNSGRPSVAHALYPNNP